MQDWDLEFYRPQVRSFLTRRRTTKREVPTKVYIVKDMGNDYAHTYMQQRLTPGDQLYEDKHMKRMYESDNINSHFLQSMWTETYEKPMLQNIM
jgi:hypothetical protein